VRILVYEFASGGGLAGRAIPASLLREGAAMRRALVEDLAAAGHDIVTTADPRVRAGRLPGIEVVTLPRSRGARDAMLDRVIAGADAAWLIAPETDQCLEQIVRRVERRGKMLLGSGADVIRRASDKSRLPDALQAMGIRHPATRTIRRCTNPAIIAHELGSPIVVKPSRGAGSQGVTVVRSPRDLRGALALANRVNRSGSAVLQEYVRGTAASVSLLGDGRDAVALTLNAQIIGASLSYRGGQTPLHHPLAARAIATALDACRGISGLRGFVGVDLILTRSDVVVIEVNPRLTTAYLGIRAAVDQNVAALALAACTGELPPPPRVKRAIRFTATGRIVTQQSADWGAA
jgi:tyramine---L-glutamate ligase